MIVYISGPIAGRPNGNMGAFEAAEVWLLERGHKPVNPHHIPKEHEGPCRGPEIPGRSHRYGCYMKADLLAMLHCDAIMLLDGWEGSRGAMVEVSVAGLCGLEFLYEVP